MKRISGPEIKKGSIPWGGDVSYALTVYEVEEVDIGTKNAHYMGYNHTTYEFRRSDVGRKIHVQKSGNWTCWGFAT